MSASLPPALFDRQLLARKRHRCAGGIGNYRFLMDWSGGQILDRFDDIKREFPVALQIGTRGDLGAQLPDKAGVQHLCSMDITPSLLTGDNSILADEEFLPFGGGSLDLIVSNLSLHSTNDLPGVLIQARRALKADGLFIASMLGGETLRELRECLMEAEMSVCGGISPRVMPFADKPEMGGLLQRAGFALPVVDSEIITVTYDTVFKLMHDLRGMGESNIINDRSRQFMRRDMLMEATRLYHERYGEDDGRLAASFEIIFLIGWSPHESQQKPLKPGSAKTRLADALRTEEHEL